ncbi:MAG: pseudouridine synthase [Candidatus Choladocola sp.]|nr:pseudouridine synthase [Candidatus Choladocola sp.]
MILYEDNDLIVCHKAAGIPVQSARLGQKDMISILNNYLAQKGESGGAIRVVHRLDQPVEGVMVFAKTKQAASFLSGKIAEGSVKKTYQAVCCVTEKAGKYLDSEAETSYTLVDYLVKNGKTNTSSVADKNSRDAKRAELSFRVLGTCGWEAVSGKQEEGTGTDSDRKYLLAEIDLKTGRHHQIRVQMAGAGLPLYGDRKYNESWEKYLTEEDSKKNTVMTALCAVSLTFPHPRTKMWKTFRIQPEAGIFHKFS